jgi:hypothetical protein
MHEALIQFPTLQKETTVAKTTKYNMSLNFNALLMPTFQENNAQLALMLGHSIVVSVSTLFTVCFYYYHFRDTINEA